MIYVYAILDGSCPVAPDVCGIAEEPLSFVANGRLIAACSSHDGSGVPPTAENVLQHERAVERLMREAVLLPARFGTAVQDDDAVRELLRAHGTELIEALERVRGCDELGVRVLQATGPEGREVAEESSPPTSGRQYMLRRMAAERLATEAQHRSEAIHQDLSSLSQASTHRRAAGFLLTGAYLVRRDGVNLFRSRVGELGAANPDLRLLCTGPWPPYNFAPRLNGREASHV